MNWTTTVKQFLISRNQPINIELCQPIRPPLFDISSGSQDYFAIGKSGPPRVDFWSLLYTISSSPPGTPPRFAELRLPLLSGQLSVRRGVCNITAQIQNLVLVGSLVYGN